MNDERMFQCHLQRGSTIMISWIEERGAVLGKHVELDGYRGRFEVMKVSFPSLTKSQLTEKQRQDRGSLPSLVHA